MVLLSIVVAWECVNIACAYQFPVESTHICAARGIRGGQAGEHDAPAFVREFPGMVRGGQAHKEKVNVYVHYDVVFCQF